MKKNIKNKICFVAVVASLLFTVLRSLADPSIIIKSPIAMADQTVKISWNAEPGGVYQVEAADSLTDLNAQGLQWMIRETDVPSKGTNAEWMDVGNPQWMPRVLPPRFQPTRFYRVTKVKQATLTPAPTVTLQLDQSNLVSGFIYATVNVAFADPDQQMSSVGIYVDGQKIYTTTDESSSTYINSSEWPNGPHEIYAIATTVDSGETMPDSDDATATNAANFAIAVSPSQFVTYSNYISKFFVSTPFFDPAAGQIQEIVASFPEDTCWRLTVLDYQYAPVRQFTGQSSSLYAAWDGNDSYGNPTYYGFYDYYIEARPSRFGGLSATSSMSLPSSATNINGKARLIPPQSQPARIQFNKLGGIEEKITIPSLNPVPSVSQSLLAPSLSVLDSKRLVTHIGTNELINGVPSFLYPPVSDKSSKPMSAFQTMSAGAPLKSDASHSSSFGDDVYAIDYPNRVPGNLFKGQAGVVGIGSQGHHPKVKNFPLPPGGIISPTRPAYGPLVNASVIANGFANKMATYGWRTGFNLQDDNLNSTNLSPVMGAYSGKGTFASRCHLGLLIGHMTATAYTDPNYYVTHSYYPIYNSRQPGRYQWIPLPDMDFGDQYGRSPLKWMCLYGCNSLRIQDANDMWSKFLLPMPPNLRLLLGSEEGVFMHPSFGTHFADSLNKMSILDAWCTAASYADTQSAKSLRYKYTMGIRHMTFVFRDNTQGGSGRTIVDSIWNWDNDLSYDWYDVNYDFRQVYPVPKNP